MVLKLLHVIQKYSKFAKFVGLYYSAFYNISQPILLVLSRLQTSKFSITSFYMASFIRHASARVYVRQILYDKFLVF